MRKRWETCDVNVEDIDPVEIIAFVSNLWVKQGK